MIFRIISIFFPVFIFASNFLLTACSRDSNQIFVKKEIALRIEPGPGNPRNSEGDFVQLKNGDIIFIYTHFTGGAGDHAGAYLASRVSKDRGRTWSSADEIVIPNEGNMNIMSVSLIRLSEEKIALFYLRKNSDSDCIPMMRTSVDEGKSGVHRADVSRRRVIS